MKNIKNFKILFNYLKDDKKIFILYIVLTIIRYFEPLINTFIWAKAFEALTNNNQAVFINYLIFWSVNIILAWVVIQLPADLIYNKLEKKFIEKVNIDLYHKISNLPAYAFEEIATGEFINRMYTDPERVLELLQKLIKLTCRLITAIIIVFISFSVSIYVGLEFIVLCVIMFILSNIYYPKIKNIQENIKKESDQYVKVATQNITGIREIKALGIKDSINNRIQNQIISLCQKQRKIGVTESFYYALNNLCYFVIQFGILLTLGLQYFNGIIPLTSFILIEKYIWRIDDAVESLSEFGVSYNKVVVSLKRIDEILNNKLYQDEVFGDKELAGNHQKIEFKDVYFKYKTDDEEVLNGLNLTIEPNKKIAIVGRSGQGKSTLFHLLLRYFDPQKGIITINGTNLKDLSEKSLRENISIIRQNPYIFNTTILENFKLVKEDITLEQVREVCKKAYIDEYIMSLPKKYDTMIGEGGINLSGGQKQRLAIARTLLKNTKVILFDEATSALDNESQEYIKKTMDDLVKDHTIIIVAHRLSTIMDADIIHLIKNGKVVASGNHKDLIKTSKDYQKLYNKEIEK